MGVTPITLTAFGRSRYRFVVGEARNGNMKTAMRRLTIVSLILTSSFLAFGADIPTGEALMEKAAAKIGSKAALAKAKSIMMSGTVSVEGRNMTGPVAVWQEAGKSVTSIEFPGVGKVEEGFDGTVAWEMNALQGARIKTGEERAAAIRAGRLNLVASWREDYKSALNLGEATVEGKPTWKVELIPNEGRPETFYFDKESGLPVRVSQILVSPLGEINVDMLVSDYREVDGIQTAFMIKQQAAGQVMVMRFTKITYSEPIPAGRFDLPAAVKAILANQNATQKK